MSYKERKAELIKNRKEILDKYKSLLTDVLYFGREVTSMSQSDFTMEELRDFERFVSQDRDTMKITSLVAALMYVEYPEDKEVSAALRRDININKHGRR